MEGKTKIVLGSRIKETWLQEDTFRDNRYQLKGLDSQARTDLAENILERINSNQSLDELKKDDDFQRLMKLLGGYPLAMEVILTNLKQQSPKEILQQLETAEINPGGDNKTNNIVKCIEYSHSNLSEASQKLLLCLAPFRGFIDRRDLKHYAEELGKLEPFQSYELEQLETAVTEAVNWGLLSPISQDYPQLLTIQPVLPYFLNTKLKEVDQTIKEALEEGFKNHYKGLAGYYKKLIESKEPQERQLGKAFVRWEYENLYQGLQICLAKEESAYAIWRCLYDYLGLISNKTEQLKLTQSVYDAVNLYQPENCNKIWEEEIVVIGINLANCYLRNQDYQLTKETYQSTLDLITKFQNIEDNQKKSYEADIYQNLGIVSQETRDYPQAKSYYEQALQIKIEYGDRFSQASTLHQLGSVSQETRDYSQAQSYYEQALQIKIDFGDLYFQASTLHELGRVSQETRDYPQAQSYYEQALQIKIEYGDLYSQGRTLHQLGRVSEETRDHPQAQSYYEQALKIFIEYGDLYSQARTLHNLGSVSQETRDYPQAQSYYEQALKIKIDFGDRFSQANTLHNLGIVSQETRDYPQAQSYYEQALKIKIDFGDRYEQAGTLHQLGRVSQETRDYPQAQSYYEQALKIFIDFGDLYSQASTLHNLGSVSQETRDYPQAQSYYEQALQIYIEYGDRYSQASTYGQLGILSETLSQFEQAKQYYLQALEIFVEFNDETYSALTLRNLANLHLNTGDNSIVTEVATRFNSTETEVRELFNKLIGNTDN